MGFQAQQTFTSDGGTFTAPAGVRSVEVLAIKTRQAYPSQGNPGPGGGEPTTSAVIDAFGKIWGWGENANGALGNGASTTVSSPVMVVAPNMRWLKVDSTWGDSSSGRSFAIDETNILWVWGGSSAIAPSGNGLAAVPNSSPVMVVGFSNIQAQKIFVKGTQMFALDVGNQCWAWGSNDAYGSLGINVVTTNQSSPVLLSGNPLIKKVVNCSQNNFFLTTANTLLAAGRNASGELGTGNITHYSSPVAVVGGYTFRDIISNGENILGLLTNGTLVAWGSNADGSIGNGTNGNAYSSPVAVAGGRSYTAIYSGINQYYAIDTAGAVWTWGNNNLAPLPIGSNVPKSSPTMVVGLGGVTPVKIVTSVYNSLSALLLDTQGRLWGWGLNVFGELGNGTVNALSSPVMVVGGLNFQDVHLFQNLAGGVVAAAIDSSANMWCWGDNEYGDCGTGVSPDVTAAYSSPVAVIGGKKFCVLSKPSRQTIAVTPGTSYAVTLEESVAMFGTTIIDSGGPFDSVVVRFLQ